MSTTMSGLHRNLLGTAQPSPETQLRAFEYAMRTKDHGLVVCLLNHPALDAVVDAKIRDVDAAAVKAAWAARPGRTSAELVGLVENEQRATVLGALAERDDLPAEVYTTLATKAKGIRVLRRVVANQSAPAQARKLALQSILVPFEGPVGPTGLDNRTIKEYKEAMCEGTEFVEEIVAQSTDLHVLTAAQFIGHAISTEQQKLYADGLMEAFGVAAKTANSNYNGLMGSINDICNAFVEANLVVDNEAADVLIALLSIHLPVADRWMKQSEERAIASLNEAKDRVSILGRFDFAKPTSLEGFAELFGDLAKEGTDKFTQKELLLLARQVIASEFSTPDQAVEASDWGYHRDMSSWMSCTNDPAKQAALINGSWYIGDLDEVLSGVDDPRAVVVEMLTYDMDKLRHVDELVASKFLSDDLLDRVPAEAFFRDHAAERLSSYAARRLDAEIGSVQAWATFETLSEDFAGSFGELIAVATTV